VPAPWSADGTRRSAAARAGALGSRTNSTSSATAPPTTVAPVSTRTASPKTTARGIPVAHDTQCVPVPYRRRRSYSSSLPWIRAVVRATAAAR